MDLLPVPVSAGEQGRERHVTRASSSSMLLHSIRAQAVDTVQLEVKQTARLTLGECPAGVALEYFHSCQDELHQVWVKSTALEEASTAASSPKASDESPLSQTMRALSSTPLGEGASRVIGQYQSPPKVLRLRSVATVGEPAKFEVMFSEEVSCQNVETVEKVLTQESSSLFDQLLDTFALQAFRVQGDSKFILQYYCAEETILSEFKKSHKWRLWRTQLSAASGSGCTLRPFHRSSLTMKDEKAEPVKLPRKTSVCPVECAKALETYIASKKSLTQHFKQTSLKGLAGLSDQLGLIEKNGKWTVREWLPNADAVTIRGDFNGWQAPGVSLEKEEVGMFGGMGYWFADLGSQIKEGEEVKLIVTSGEHTEDRLLPTSRTVRRQEENKITNCVAVTSSFSFKHAKPQAPTKPYLYEAHIGSSHWNCQVGTYQDFTRHVLPRVKRNGYNGLVLMGIQEHNVYSSFGWHVTSPYAHCSTFGSADDLRELVDTAHMMGVAVYISVLLSHHSPDPEGLSGADPGYFRSGAAGHHAAWDARIYNYESPEVQLYLLAQLDSFARSLNIDGFRFEAVQSMLYNHHYIGYNFGADFSQLENQLDTQAVQMLQLASDLTHELGLTAYAHDESCSLLCTTPTSKGGIGFDGVVSGRCASAIRNFLGACRDEQFSVTNLFDQLSAASGPSHINQLEGWDQLLRAKRPLKVAFFSWESLHTHAVGGVAPHVTELAAGLARLGHEVHVFTRATTEVAAHHVHFGVHYHECPFDLTPDFVLEVTHMCQSLTGHMFKSEEFMNDHFAVCHAHDWLAAQCLNSSVPAGRKSILTMHSTEFGRCGNNTYAGQSARIRDIERRGCSTSDMTICVSGVLADEVKHFYSSPSEKIRVIYNGIEAHNFDGFVDGAPIKATIGVGAMEPMFLFVGRLATQKGPDILVEAIPHILKFRGDAKFVIVGDGYMKAELVQRVAELGVAGAVRFLGSKGGNELRNLFKVCDAVVVPSRNEPFGIVVLEAWASYKPVIATTSGGPRDFVTPHVDGYLVEPNPSSVSWGCCELLKNFDHAKWMGEMGRAKADTFSWDTIARQTRDVYNELLNRSDAPYGVAALSAKHDESSLSSRLMGHYMHDHMTVFDDNEEVAR
ncbi:MAG: hypothetical protein KVP17_003150 [Porospora cf. gigantea B]|nr:MAG: hypothetical protein KVP17_003150 [Porospora cf. gigantea B]